MSLPVLWFIRGGMLAALLTAPVAVILATESEVASHAEAVNNDLKSLVEELLEKNPQLQAALAMSKAARAQAGVEGNIEAPQVGVDFYQTPLSSFPNPLKDSMENDFFIQQDIMFPGKLFTMASAANRRADMLEQDARMQSQRLVRNLKNSYYELYETDRKLEINQQNLNLMRQLQDITRKQYELGMGNQSDVLRAQTEYSSLQNVRLMLNQSRQSAAVEINSLLNRQADTPLGVLPSMEIPQNQVWTLGQLTVLVEKNQPELNAARFGIAMSNAEHGASFWGFFPDLMVKGAYKQFPSSPDNFWELMVGITLPGIPWSLPKYIAKYEQTSATANQSEAAFRQTRNMVFAQVQQTLFRVKTNRDIEQLSRTTLLPQAEQTLQSTLAAYQTGKRDFMTLLDAYRTLWMARENYVMTVRNLLTSQADLEQAVGLSLPEIEAMLATHGGQ